METKERIPCYDHMKAVAIIMVIMGHVTLFSFGARDSILLVCVASVHLYIFFMVSGYFAYKATTNSTLKQLAFGLLGRTCQLIVPLVVWGALWCVATGKDIVSFCYSGGGGYWFLWVLWLSFCLLSVLDYLSKKLSLKFWGDIVLLVVAYGCVVALDVLLQRYFSFSYLHSLVTFTRYFMLGYLMRKHDVLKRLLLSDVACATGLCLYLLQVYFSDCFFRPLIFLGSLGGVIVVWRFFERSFSADSRAGRWLSTVGRSTLYIYCAHWFLLSDLTAYVAPYVDVPMGFFVQLAGSLVYALLVVAALMAVEKIITHNPILNTLLLGAKPSRTK